MGIKGITLPEVDRGRAVGIAVATVGVIVVLWLAVSVVGGFSSMRGRVAAARAELDTFRELGTSYLERKARVDSFAARAVVAGRPVSVLEIVEDLVGRVGVEGGVASMKPQGERTVDGYTERTVEFTLERIDLNQLTNLLYLMDNSRALLVVRDLSMKSRFESPDLLDVTLKVAHLVRVPV